MNGQRLPMADGSTTVERRTERLHTRPRLPEWFRTSLPTGERLKAFNETRNNIDDNMLTTVCQEARCPNIHECWGRGTATFMIAGEECTRGCRFCAVGSIKNPPPLDDEEPQRLADSVKRMGLEHAVITVVNRDDLDDSGAGHYRRSIEAVHKLCPETSLELLCSDLAGDLEDLAQLLIDLPLDVFAHNVECVPRLDRTVRDHRASFSQSLEILRQAKLLRPDILTKSSLMVGMGESHDEVVEVLHMLHEAGVELLTIGQYLQPSEQHMQVVSFPEPEQFDLWAEMAIEIGFKGVASGPLVRSSYRAGVLLRKVRGVDEGATIPNAALVADNTESEL